MLHAAQVQADPDDAFPAKRFCAGGSALATAPQASSSDIGVASIAMAGAATGGATVTATGARGAERRGVAVAEDEDEESDMDADGESALQLATRLPPAGLPHDVYQAMCVAPRWASKATGGGEKEEGWEG